MSELGYIAYATNDGVRKNVHEYFGNKTDKTPDNIEELKKILKDFIGTTVPEPALRSETQIDAHIQQQKNAFRSFRHAIYRGIAKKDEVEFKRIEANFYFFLDLYRKLLLLLKDVAQKDYTLDDVNIQKLLDPKDPKGLAEVLESAEKAAIQTATPLKAIVGDLKSSYYQTFTEADKEIQELIKNWVPYRYRYYKVYQEDPLQIKEFKEKIEEYKERRKQDSNNFDRMMVALLSLLQQASVDKKIKESVITALDNIFLPHGFKLTTQKGGDKQNQLIPYFDAITVSFIPSEEIIKNYGGWKNGIAENDKKLENISISFTSAGEIQLDASKKTEIIRQFENKFNKNPTEQDFTKLQTAFQGIQKGLMDQFENIKVPNFSDIKNLFSRKPKEPGYKPPATLFDDIYSLITTTQANIDSYLNKNQQPSPVDEKNPKKKETDQSTIVSILPDIHRFLQTVLDNITTISTKYTSTAEGKTTKESPTLTQFALVPALSDELNSLQKQVYTLMGTHKLGQDSQNANANIPIGTLYGSIQGLLNTTLDNVNEFMTGITSSPGTDKTSPSGLVGIQSELLTYLNSLTDNLADIKKLQQGLIATILRPRNGGLQREISNLGDALLTNILGAGYITQRGETEVGLDHSMNLGGDVGSLGNALLENLFQVDSSRRGKDKRNLEATLPSFGGELNTMEDSLLQNILGVNAKASPSEVREGAPSSQNIGGEVGSLGDALLKNLFGVNRPHEKKDAQGATATARNLGGEVSSIGDELLKNLFRTKLPSSNTGTDAQKREGHENLGGEVEELNRGLLQELLGVKGNASGRGETGVADARGAPGNLGGEVGNQSDALLRNLLGVKGNTSGRDTGAVDARGAPGNLGGEVGNQSDALLQNLLGVKGNASGRGETGVADARGAPGNLGGEVGNQSDALLQNLLGLKGNASGRDTGVADARGAPGNLGGEVGNQNDALLRNLLGVKGNASGKENGAADARGAPGNLGGELNRGHEDLLDALGLNLGRIPPPSPTPVIENPEEEVAEVVLQKYKIQAIQTVKGLYDQLKKEKNNDIINGLLEKQNFGDLENATKYDYYPKDDESMQLLHTTIEPFVKKIRDEVENTDKIFTEITVVNTVKENVILETFLNNLNNSYLVESRHSSIVQIKPLLNIFKEDAFQKEHFERVQAPPFLNDIFTIEKSIFREIVAKPYIKEALNKCLTEVKNYLSNKLQEPIESEELWKDMTITPIPHPMIPPTGDSTVDNFTEVPEYIPQILNHLIEYVVKAYKHFIQQLKNDKEKIALFVDSLQEGTEEQYNNNIMIILVQLNIQLNKNNNYNDVLLSYLSDPSKVLYKIFYDPNLYTVQSYLEYLKSPTMTPVKLVDTLLKENFTKITTELNAEVGPRSPTAKGPIRPGRKAAVDAEEEARRQAEAKAEEERIAKAALNYEATKVEDIVKDGARLSSYTELKSAFDETLPEKSKYKDLLTLLYYYIGIAAIFEENKGINIGALNPTQVNLFKEILRNGQGNVELVAKKKEKETSVQVQFNGKLLDTIIKELQEKIIKHIIYLRISGILTTVRNTLFTENEVKKGDLSVNIKYEVGTYLFENITGGIQAISSIKPSTERSTTKIDELYNTLIKYTIKKDGKQINIFKELSETAGGSSSPIVGGTVPMASKPEETEEKVTPVSGNVTLDAVKADVENARKLNKKVSEVENEIDELRNIWETYKRTVPVKEFKDLRPKPLLQELLTEISKEIYKRTVVVDTISSDIQSHNIFSAIHIQSSTKHSLEPAYTLTFEEDDSKNNYEYGVYNIALKQTTSSIQNQTNLEALQKISKKREIFITKLDTLVRLLDIDKYKYIISRYNNILKPLLAKYKDTPYASYDDLKNVGSDIIKGLEEAVGYVQFDKIKSIIENKIDKMPDSMFEIFLKNKFQKRSSKDKDTFLRNAKLTEQTDPKEETKPTTLFETTGRIKSDKLETVKALLKSLLIKNVDELSQESKELLGVFYDFDSETFIQTRKNKAEAEDNQFKEITEKFKKLSTSIIDEKELNAFSNTSTFKELSSKIFQKVFLDQDNILISQKKGDVISKKIYFKLDIEAVKNFIEDIQRIYNEIPGYTPEEIQGIDDYFQKEAGKNLKTDITAKIEKISKDYESVMKKFTEYAKKYAEVNPAIKTDILYKLEPTDISESEKIQLLSKLNEAKRIMFLDIDANINNFRKNALALRSSSSTSMGGGKKRKQRGGDKTEAEKARTKVDEAFNKIPPDPKSGELNPASLYASTAEVKKIGKRFYDVMARATDPATALTLQGHDSLFNMLFNKYQESKRDPLKGEYVASVELSEALKANELLPRDVLKINFQDKTIFIFTTLFLRLLSLSIVEFLVDKNKITRLNTAVLTFLGIYTGMFYLLVLAVNVDTYKLRIIFNYVNFHVNSSVGIVYPAMLWIFGGAIYYIMWNINGGEGATATNDEDRLRLKYKLQVLSMITWLFLSLMVVLF